jgi:signal transduction histidine kinase
VFLVGIGCLLLLIFLPGVAALRQSGQVYRDFTEIQSAQEDVRNTLVDIERGVLHMSVIVRDFLLDNSPAGTGLYRTQFEQSRSEVNAKLEALSSGAPREQRPMLSRLRVQLAEYWVSMQPVFEWSPQERDSHARDFLREQQRPRRHAILSIADEIGRLSVDNYRRRYAEIKASQERYRRQLEVAIGAAFLFGVVIAAATILRISVLERQSESQRLATESAERELRTLSTRLRQAQEEERRSISRELHDEVGQTLTALRMQLGTLDRLRVGPERSFRTHLDEAKSLAEQTMRAVRDLAMGLRPSVLDLGLEPAIQWQARHFSRTTGMEACVKLGGDFPPLPDSHLTCIYRIVQEALTNSARHSQAHRVEIAVGVEGKHLELVIRDDGVGLRPGWTDRRGLGLLGIEERAREIGGSVAIESGAENGVSIRVRLPIAVEDKT